MILFGEEKETITSWKGMPATTLFAAGWDAIPFRAAQATTHWTAGT